MTGLAGRPELSGKLSKPQRVRVQTSLPVCRAGDGSAGEKGTNLLLLGSLLERDERQQLSLEVKNVEGDPGSCERPVRDRGRF